MIEQLHSQSKQADEKVVAQEHDLEEFQNQVSQLTAQLQDQQLSFKEDIHATRKDLKEQIVYSQAVESEKGDL